MSNGNGKHLAWLVPVLFGGALVVVALVQGLVVQEVGIPGVASVKFGERRDATGDAPPTSTAGKDQGGDGAATSGSADTPGPAPAPVAQSEPVVGSWTAERGDVAVEVTQVENQGGHLRIDATVTNGTGDSLSVPLFGNVTAVDEAGRAYEADPFNSDWVDTISSGQSVGGTIEFDGLYEVGPGTLTLTFAELYGFDAPSGGVVVPGVGRP